MKGAHWCEKTLTYNKPVHFCKMPLLYFATIFVTKHLCYHANICSLYLTKLLALKPMKQLFVKKT